MLEIKKILINASTVKISGGLYIALDIISAFVKSDNLLVSIICPNIRPFRSYKEKANLIHVPTIFFNYLFRPLLDYWWLNRRINKLKPDLIISLSNLPARTHRRQFFFHDNAYMSQPDLKGLKLSFKNLMINYIRRRIFRNRIRFINHLIVQTKLEKIRLNQLYSTKLPITVMPPILPSHLNRKTDNKKYFKREPNTVYIACLSRYYEHKNIEILLDVAQLCEQQNLQLKFVITIDATQGKGAQRLLNNIGTSNYSQRIINIGKIGRKKISSFIQSIDSLILPSLIETFGLNCIEAWYFKKPLFISDRHYSRQICSNSAIYFDPLDARSIVNVLSDFYKNNQEYPELIAEGKNKITQLLKAEEAVEKILNL